MRGTFATVWRNNWVRAAVYVLLILAALYALQWTWDRARGVINIILLAFVLSYATSPVVRWFERRRLTRALGVGVVFVGILLFFGVATVMLASMVGQLAGFVNNLPQLLNPLLGWAQSLPDRVGRLELPPLIRDALNQATGNLETLLQGFTQTLLGLLRALLAQGGSLLGFVTGLLGGAFQLLTVFTIMIYLLYDLPRIGTSLFRSIPEPYQPRAAEVAAKADRAFGGFVRGTLLVGLANGLVVAVAMYVAFGIFEGFGGGTLAKAMSLGFLAFVFSFIPVIGVLISAVPALLLALPLGLPGLLAVGVALWLCNQVQGFIGPPIFSTTTSIHPVTGIAGALIGASLFGLPGALLSGAVLAFLKILYTDYYLNSRFYKEG